MARHSALTKSQWETVKIAWIAGTPKKALIEAFRGLTIAALEKAAERGNWPTPERIKTAIRKRVSQPQKTQRKGASEEPPKDAFTIVSDMSYAAKLDNPDVSIDQIGQINAMSEARKVSRALGTTAPPEIKTWKDRHLAVQIVQSVTGRDKPQTTIGIAISTGAWGSGNVEELGGGPA